MAFGPDHPDYADWDRERKYIGLSYLPTPDEIEAETAKIRPIKEQQLILRHERIGFGTKDKKRLFIMSGNRRIYL